MLIKVKLQNGNKTKVFFYKNENLVPVETVNMNTPYIMYSYGFKIEASVSIKEMQKDERLIFNQKLSRKLKQIISQEINKKNIIKGNLTKKRLNNIRAHKKKNNKTFNIIQKEKLLCEFLNTLRHEISNPIAGIKLAVTFMASKNKSANDIEINQEIMKSSEKIIDLIRSTPNNKKDTMKYLKLLCLT